MWYDHMRKRIKFYVPWHKADVRLSDIRDSLPIQILTKIRTCLTSLFLLETVFCV